MKKGNKVRLNRVIGLFVLGMAMAFNLAAQEAEDKNAPQVLTSDLTARQEIESDTLSVSFVFVDEDDITKITIDGEPQEFEPGDTVVITKDFVFGRGITNIKVVAEDEKGNLREITYVVAFGVSLPPLKKAKKDKGLKISVVLEVTAGNDDNPTQDLSLPFTVSSIGEIEGVVDDSEQDDNFTDLKGIVSLSAGTLSGYAGISQKSYSKSENANIESDVIFVGGNWRPGGKDGGFVLGLTLTDIAVGGEDFSTMVTLAPGIEVPFKDEDGAGKSLFGVDIISKMFEGETRDDVTQFTFKWVVTDKDKEKQDSARKVWSFGTNSEGGTNDEGKDPTEFNFIGFDGDWQNRWDSGFRWDIGFGIQYRQYTEDEDILTDDLFGDKRVDNIFRFSTGIGWEFTPKISALLNYRYLFDLSNDSPYVRQIIGITAKGTF